MSSSSHIHYRYAIAALAVALIGVVAVSFHEVPKLVEIVSFALTLTSLVLAFVSIIYTFVVTNRQEGQLAALTQAGSSIASASTEVQKASAAISEHIQEIPVRLETLESKLMTLATAPASVAESSGGTEELPQLSDAQFKRYFANLRYAAMAALYLYVRAYRDSRAITRDLTETIGSPSLDVMAGALSAFEGAGLLRIAVHKQALIPVDCSNVVLKAVPAQVKQILEFLGESGVALQSMIESIDRAFDGVEAPEGES